MEDQLLRIFGGERMRAIADRLKLEEGVAIESKMLTRMIESAQRKVEGRNYDIRKQLLEFDDVQNDQRHEIYGLRNDILEKDDVSELITSLREGYFTDMFRACVPEETVEEQWDLDKLRSQLQGNFGIDIDFRKLLDENDQFTDEDLLKVLIDKVNEIYQSKEDLVGHEPFNNLARAVLIGMLDQLWRQHISALDALRQGIYLRGYAQKQPKQEYKREAFTMFEALLDQIRESVVMYLMRLEIRFTEDEPQSAAENAQELPATEANSSQGAAAVDPEAFKHCGRNDPCPCGSGLRFKDCHGKL